MCAACACVRRALCWRHTGLLGRSEYVVDYQVGTTIQGCHIKNQYLFTCMCALYMLIAIPVHAAWRDWTTVVTQSHACVCSVYCASLDDAYTCHTAHVNKSTLDNSPPPNYDKESKDECHHVNNSPRYKWYVK